jgi:hypothetical protein
LCALLGLLQDGDHLPSSNIASVVEIQPDDALGDGRRDRHLLVGARGPDGVDPVGESHGRGRLGLDQRRRPVAIILGLPGAAGGDEKSRNDDQKRELAHRRAAHAENHALVETAFVSNCRCIGTL